MHSLPIFLKLDGRPALVVGGGEAAAQKVRLLRRAGAVVTLMAPEATAELRASAAAGDLLWHARAFHTSDLDDVAVAIAANPTEDEDAEIATVARAAGVPVNCVDRPGLSTFTVPAIVDRDPVVIGISTGGTAPVLARRVRAQIEQLLPAGLGRLARFADSFRGAVRAKVPAEARRGFWEQVMDGPIAARLRAGDETGARERMLALVNRPQERPEGSVAIVGAGPGDADLLTLRAHRALADTDVVVYDKLVGPAILDYVRRDAEQIFVGKTKGHHALPRDDINALLVRLAREGKRVVRLKGGDPFVFGRGGEELEALRRAGVAAEVVPGITAATGCGAAIGIPLTHRDHASAVTFVTGHGKDGAPAADWAALARGRQTIVIYMGVSTAAETAGRLIDAGLGAATPAAIVENGTLPEQRVVVGTVAMLGSMVATHAIQGPALIVIGDVVALADSSAITPALATAV